jgi:ABC-2 type transport system ATP-binding protein
MSEVAISVKNFHKSYGSFTAVDNISFTVRKGEIFGLLGPNGAGKTTTLECIEGLRKHDQGTLEVLGLEPGKETTRMIQLIGVQLQAGSLPDYITVKEAVKLFSAYRGIKPDYTIVERIGLFSSIDTQYHALSTGQKRRLALVLAVNHHPSLLILDEPTAGLDVGSRNILHEMINELKNKGTTILLSTHDMAEAESLADRVAILIKGQIAAMGTPRELTASGAGYTKISVRTVRNSLQSITMKDSLKKENKDDYYLFFVRETANNVSLILEHIKKSNDELIDLRVERPSLEERFIELTNEGVIQ